MSTPYTKGKQQVCRNFLAGNCTRRNCPFQHPKAGGGGGGGGGGKPATFAGSSQILVTVLKLLLEKAQLDVYVPEEKRLIISNFKSSPDIQSMVSSIDFNTATFCDALCTAIAEKLGPTGLSILDVSSNEIRSITHLANALKKHGLHINLAGLSCANNNISTTDFATSLQSFPNLQQLVMLNNPVVNNADYRQTVRKRLPHLVGLDKQPIQRPPLSLPWPRRESMATGPASADALSFVEAYFSTINTQGLDAVIDRYHVQAVFSFSFANEQSTVKWDASSTSNGSNTTNNNNPTSSNGLLTSPSRRPLPNKDVLRDVTALRVKQSEGNHNIMKGMKKDNIARGRVEVVSKLAHLIYHRSFSVEHVFQMPISCSIISENAQMPFPMIVITAHGFMRWRHLSANDVDFTRSFDRTITLVQNTTGGGSFPFFIANDAIELRPQADDVLFFADTPARTEMIARKFNLPPSIAYACSQIASAVVGTDQAWMEILAELQNNVPMSILEMVAVQLGMGNPIQVVNVARLMARRQIADVGQAAQMLAAAGGDLNSVQ